MPILIFYSVFEIISLFFLYMYQSKKEKENTERKKYHIKKSTICLIISFLILLVLVGFRNIDVGVDTINYASAFQRIAENTLTTADRDWLGIGYIFLCKIITSLFGSNYIIINLVIGFLTLFFFYQGIIHNSDEPTFSLYILICTCLYYQMFNQSRQMLAISIIFYNYKNLVNNNLKSYLFFTLLASSIHLSSLVMLPIYFLSKLKINKKNLVLYILIVLASIAFFPEIIKIISSTSYGMIYQNTGYFQSNISSLINLIFRVMLIIICFVISRFTKDKMTNERETKCFNIAIWCVLFQVIATRIYIVGRITTYFYVIFILLIPNLIKKIEKEGIKKIIKIGAILCFIIYHTLYFNIVAETSGYDHYQFGIKIK